MQRRFLQFLLFCSLSLLVLSGCGGGGGGGGKPHIDDKLPNIVKFTKWTDSPSPGVLYVDGTAQSGTYDFTGTTEEIKDEGIHSSETIIVYDETGKIIKMTLKAHNTDVTWDVRDGDTIDVRDQFLIFDSKDRSNNALFTNPKSSTLPFEYQTFGLWQTGTGSKQGTFGAASIGAQTTGSAIPRLGQATFSGVADGNYIDANGKEFLVYSTVKVSADFNSRSLDFSTLGTQKISVDTTTGTDAAYLNMTGNLTYAAETNNFTGAVTAAGVAAGGLKGKSTGHFYGPLAEELGGVFFLNNAGSIETYHGAYGAKR